jgi:hypothetical protein
VRLHGQPTPPNEDDLAREAQEYAVSRFPYMESGPAAEPAVVTGAKRRRDHSWSMIEID